MTSALPGPSESQLSAFPIWSTRRKSNLPSSALSAPPREKKSDAICQLFKAPLFFMPFSSISAFSFCLSSAFNFQLSAFLPSAFLPRQCLLYRARSIGYDFSHDRPHYLRSSSVQWTSLHSRHAHSRQRRARSACRWHSAGRDP